MKFSRKITPPVKEWTRGVIVDTGPLLVGLASYIEFDDKIPAFVSRRILDQVTRNDPSIRDDVDFRRAFLTWLESQRTIRTTAHVLAELQSHIRRCQIKDSYEASVWEGCIEFWEQVGINEDALRLQDKWRERFFREMIGKIGPTDTAIIVLAAILRLPILTSDSRTLTHFARETGVRVFHLADLR